jgi:hypothetical protein
MRARAEGCIHRAMRKIAILVAFGALLAPASALAARSAADPATVATKVCSRLQSRFGDAFSKRFTSVSDCESQLGSLVQAAVGSCSGQTAVAPGLCARTARIAGRLCLRLDTRAGARFAAAFGDLPGCESSLTALAQSAIASCKSSASPGSAAFRTCVKSALRAAATNH